MVRYQPPMDWQEWVNWLAAGLHGRSRWRLSLILMGMLFAKGRRTVTTWLRAAGIHDDFADYYYFLQPLGRKSKPLAERLWTMLLLRMVPGRVLLVVDDSPTKRYGPQVQGAGIHHNPTPGPADQKFLYGHIWVTISLALRHRLWQTIGLPLVGLLYVRAKDIDKIPPKHHWEFHTKLELAAQQVLQLAKMAQAFGKIVWVVVDGAYAKRPFLKPLCRLASSWSAACGKTRPCAICHGSRSSAVAVGHGNTAQADFAGPPGGASARAGRRSSASPMESWSPRPFKTFLATYRPAGGVIRVVIIREDHGCQFFFCTEPATTPREIIETFADRATIEQDFHDVKEVWGAGQQQVRNIWTNMAVFNLNLWMHTLVECWAWNQSADSIRDRSDSPWDDADRRPSHANRRKALRRQTLHNEYSELSPAHRRSSKIRNLYQWLLQLAA